MPIVRLLRCWWAFIRVGVRGEQPKAMAREDSFDLINLDGPLTVEAILKTLQQRFMDGHCYVSPTYPQ